MYDNIKVERGPLDICRMLEYLHIVSSVKQLTCHLFDNI